MVLRNLTKDVQTVRLHELVGGYEYDIYLQPTSDVEIDNSLIAVNLKDLSGKVEFVTKSVESPRPVIEIQPQVVEEVKTDSDKTSDVKEPEVLSSTFVCKICQAEFASERGLNAHVSRAHKE